MLVPLASLLLCVVVRMPSAEPTHKPALHFKNVAHIRTQANAGFTPFRISSPDIISGHHLTTRQRQFIAAANSWDVQSATRSAETEIFEVSIRSDGPLPDGVNMDGSVRVRSVQSLPGKGAASFDFLTVGSETHLLVLANRFGCGPATASLLSEPSQAQCNSTVIYTQRADQRDWTKWGSLPAVAPTATTHFTLAGQPHIVVAEHSEAASLGLKIFRVHLDSNGAPARFQLVQQLPCAGAVTAVAAIKADGVLWLIAAAWKASGASTKSPVFRLNSEQGLFEFHHAIQTNAPRGVIIWQQRSTKQMFVFFAEERNEETTSISSQLFIYDMNTTRFQLHQSLPTDGAHGATHFNALNGEEYLAVANFGDRTSKRYKAVSAVYTWDQEELEYRLVQELDTRGATGFAHFVLEDSDFLAVSCEGDIGKKKHQKSKLYRHVVQKPWHRSREEL
eukprot:SAG31_NODE_1911_length_6936_cov_124.794501_3_plen_449_part_00